MTTETTTRPTFLGAVQRSFAKQAGRPALTFLASGEPEKAEDYSFADLDVAARSVAADLQLNAVRPGDRVMLLQSPGWHMVAGFLGCIYAGAIAVPAYPPSPFLGARGAERLTSMRKDASATAAVTTTAILPLLQFPDEDRLPLSWVFTDKLQGSPEAYTQVDVSPEDVSFLQYTSGSTTAPKGVRVTHRALLTNIMQIIEMWGMDEDTVFCSWLPPFHDMGLIASILAPLVGGFRTIQMAPESFLRRPERWLKAISHYRAGHSWAPNFAYDLCVRRVKNLDGIDLSSWKVAGNAAEPVRERTMEDFARKFAACGLRPDFLWSGYGLAEATLMVSVRQRGPGSTMWIDPDELSEGRLVPLNPPQGRPLVCCGPPAPGTTITIRHPETTELVDDGIVGEIWVGGPQVCDGYWEQPALNEKVFPDDQVRTGDLGVLWKGEVYVTGRLKDLLIVRGRNHYPQDIEQTMEAADPDLRPTCGVAVAVPTDTGEQIVLIQEVLAGVATGTAGKPELIVEKIRRRVIEQHGISVDAIVLVKPGAVPKTTSGKLRRSSAAEMFRTGTLRVVHQWTAPAGS